MASSIPVMVYLLWCHYPLQTLLGISVRPFITAAAVFTFYNALAIGEIVRAAVGICRLLSQWQLKPQAFPEVFTSDLS